MSDDTNAAAKESLASDRVLIVGFAYLAAATLHGVSPTEAQVEQEASKLSAMMSPTSSLASVLHRDQRAASNIFPGSERHINGTLIGVDIQTRSKRLVLILGGMNPTQYNATGVESFTSVRMDDSASAAQYASLRDKAWQAYGRRVSLAVANEIDPKDSAKKGYKFCYGIDVGEPDPAWSANTAESKYNRTMASDVKQRPFYYSNIDANAQAAFYVANPQAFPAQ